MAGDLDGEDLNSAKAVLAFEATALAHGLEEAINAYNAAGSMFGFRIVPDNMLPSSLIPRRAKENDDSVPCTDISEEELGDGIPAFKILYMTGLASSGGAARRLIEQGGGYINGERIQSAEYMVTKNDFNGADILLRAGKKRYHRIKIKK